MPGEAVKHDGDRLSVRASLPKTILLALGSALFVVAGFFIGCGALLGVLDSGSWAPLALVGALPILAIGLASFAFFGFGLIYFLKRLVLFRRSVFAVGPEGIYDDASAFGAGLIPWREISHLRVASIAGRKYLGVRLKGHTKVLDRQNPLKRFIMTINRDKFTGTLVNVPQTILPINVEELLREVEAYRVRHGF